MQKMRYVGVVLGFIGGALLAGCVTAGANSSLSSFPEGTPLVDVIPGIWIVRWNHSILEYADDQGNKVTVEDWSPGSYAYIGEIQGDSFYYFRSDGTGQYFDRLLRISGEGDDATVTVVEHVGDGEHRDRDVIRNIPFTWSLEGNTLLLEAPESPLVVHARLTTFEVSWHRNNSARGDDQLRETTTPEGMRLQEELAIVPLAILRRVHPDDASSLIERYALDE